MSERLKKRQSAEFMAFYARLDKETRTILKFSAIDALRRVRAGEFNDCAISDQIMIVSPEIDKMDRILRGKFRKKVPV